MTPNTRVNAYLVSPCKNKKQPKPFSDLPVLHLQTEQSWEASLYLVLLDSSLSRKCVLVGVSVSVCMQRLRCKLQPGTLFRKQTSALLAAESQSTEFRVTTK